MLFVSMATACFEPWPIFSLTLDCSLESLGKVCAIFFLFYFAVLVKWPAIPHFLNMFMPEKCLLSLRLFQPIFFVTRLPLFLCICYFYVKKGKIKIVNKSAGKALAPSDFFFPLFSYLLFYISSSLSSGTFWMQLFLLLFGKSNTSIFLCKCFTFRKLGLQFSRAPCSKASLLKKNFQKNSFQTNKSSWAFYCFRFFTLGGGKQPKGVFWNICKRKRIWPSECRKLVFSSFRHPPLQQVDSRRFKVPWRPPLSSPGGAFPQHRTGWVEASKTANSSFCAQIFWKLRTEIRI